jgi:hypothetical protein
MRIWILPYRNTHDISIVLLKHGRKKMNLTILLALLISAIATAQPETESNLTVEEIFSVETTQELEASLTDGYPMPWLAEILEDESIPEEDRYWLDCRVRAVIARELHTFFDRENNRIDVEAEGGIRNGEAYWREVFIVEPDFVDYQAIAIEQITSIWSDIPEVVYPEPYHFIRTPGYLCNRFGEKIGDIATTDLKIHLSRDGRVGVYTSGWYQHQNPSRVFFLNSNNEVRELVIGPRVSGTQSISLSDDGSLALVVCAGYHEYSINRDAETDLDLDYSNGPTLMVFTGTGDLLYSRKVPDFPSDYPAQFSPDNRFIAYPMGDETYLLDATTGETIYTLDIYGGGYPYFTRNSRYLCIPAISGAAFYDCETGENVAEFTENPYPEYGFSRNYHEGISASNDLSVTTGERIVRPPLEPNQYYNEIFLNFNLYSSEKMQVYKIQEVSPNGFFIDLQNYSPFIGNLWDGPAIPYTVFTVKGER